MRKLFQTWKAHFYYLIEEHIISYYTFFTVIFAECAYLWAFHTKFISIGLTIVLLAYIGNVLVFSWLKSFNEGERKELIMARLYVVGFIVIFIVGCFINFWLTVILTLIPFVITYLWLGIREFQDDDYSDNWDGIIGALVRLFKNKVFWIISQVFVIGLPYLAFTVMLVLIPNISLILKIVIAILYLICAPFVAYVPCIDVCCHEITYWNIFEIAYDISYYDCEKEKKRRERLEKKWYNSQD